MSTLPTNPRVQASHSPKDSSGTETVSSLVQLKPQCFTLSKVIPETDPEKRKNEAKQLMEQVINIVKTVSNPTAGKVVAKLHPIHSKGKPL